MTREETQKILMSVQALFPNYSPPNKTVVVNAWSEMFSEYTYEQVMAGLKAYALTETSGFAPSIGQLIEKIQFLSAPQQLNEMEAWSLVSRAIRNGAYGAEEEFAKLPELVQKAVGQPSQIRQWAMTDFDSIENVIQSNFMRTYRTVCQREKEVSKLPLNIKNLIGATNNTELLENAHIRHTERDEVQLDGVPMPESAKKRMSELFS